MEVKFWLFEGNNRVNCFGCYECYNQRELTRKFHKGENDE